MGITTNLGEVKALLKEFSEGDAYDISLKATRRAGARVRTRVRQYVPVKSGELKKSIRLKIRAERSINDFRAVVYGRIGYYATLLYGKRNAHERNGSPVRETVINNPAGNWFDKALAAHSTEFEQAMAKALQAEMKKAAGRIYRRTLMTASRLSRRA